MCMRMNVRIVLALALARVSRAAGSLGHSCFDPRPMLVGASGGGYALIGAHLANLFRVCTLRYCITIVCITISNTENTFTYSAYFCFVCQLLDILVMYVREDVQYNVLYECTVRVVLVQVSVARCTTLCSANMFGCSCVFGACLVWSLQRTWETYETKF